jgi:pyruvate dehydrogenase E2 component (dihydrolipoamide acetyltransferase)
MDIRVPRLGEGADSGSVVGILVKVGDRIAKDQPLIELENEKAVASIPSTAGGTVTKIHVRQGDQVSVGQVLVTISEDRGQPPAAAKPSRGRPAAVPPPEAPAEARVEEPPETAQPAGGVAPPSVRRLARQLGIDLTRVRGTDPGGRISLADVRAYVQRLQRAASAQPSGGGREAQAAGRGAPPVDFAKWGPVTRTPITSMRRTIAQRMTESWTTIPHVTQFDEADVGAAQALVQKHRTAYRREGITLTMTSVILKILAALLREHPKFMTSLDEAAGEIVQKRYCHIGVAVDTEAGLMVPVLRDVDKKPLKQVAKELKELAEKARTRTISAEELHGGTISVSNQGGIGGAHFTPIIRAPEAAILGLGRVRTKTVERGGAMEARPMLPLALSYDHRLIDGADAARFIRELVNAIGKADEAVIAP